MKKTNITPLADRVLVQQDAAETTTASGIIIPDNAQEKPQKGKVVAVGKGLKDEPMTVKVGDNILYAKYGGTELKYNEQEYLIQLNEIFDKIRLTKKQKGLLKRQ